MKGLLQNTKFKQVSIILFITSFYIFSLIIGNADKGKKKLQHQITNNKKVIGLKDMLIF